MIPLVVRLLDLEGRESYMNLQKLLPFVMQFAPPVNFMGHLRE